MQFFKNTLVLVAAVAAFIALWLGLVLVMNVGWPQDWKRPVFLTTCGAIFFYLIKRYGR